MIAFGELFEEYSALRIHNFSGCLLQSLLLTLITNIYLLFIVELVLLSQRFSSAKFLSLAVAMSDPSQKSPHQRSSGKAFEISAS